MRRLGVLAIALMLWAGPHGSAIGQVPEAQAQQPQETVRDVRDRDGGDWGWLGLIGLLGLLGLRGRSRGERVAVGR